MLGGEIALMVTTKHILGIAQYTGIRTGLGKDFAEHFWVESESILDTQPSARAAVLMFRPY